MPTMIGGEVLDSGRVLVTLNDLGTGTGSVSFRESYTAAPAVCVHAQNEPLAVVTAASVTKTGFTATVTASQLTDSDIYVYWAAVGV